MKKLLLILVLPLLTTAQQVTTFAGFGGDGYQDGPIAIAQFSGMYGACFDADGNMYVSDTGNNRIRKISTDGIVTTLAGSAEGFADGVGSAAMFNLPIGICIDAIGNLYVADQNNHRIRKITPDGTVTTIAGSSTAGYADGIGNLAKFYFPVGICIDSAGNLYIADSLNHKIRKITPAGVVSTIAGSTAGFADGIGTTAKFNFPSSICVDSSNNLLIADQNNHRIRKITPAGVVTTVAGTTWGNTDGPANVAQLDAPRGICIDNNGNIFIANSGHHNIRKIDTGGNVTTYAGGSTAGNVDGIGTAARFATPAGITIKSDGTIYVVQDNGRIRKIINVLSNTDFNKNNVAIYPNPCKDKFNIKIEEKIDNVTIYDILGNKVYYEKCVDNMVVIKNNLNKGVYIAHFISNNSNIFVTKLMIE